MGATADDEVARVFEARAEIARKHRARDTIRRQATLIDEYAAKVETLQANQMFLVDTIKRIFSTEHFDARTMSYIIPKERADRIGRELISDSRS